MTRDNAFVVVANRLPVDRTAAPSGWQASPGGLVAALAPVLRERSGCWVGWPGEPDVEIAPFEFEGISLRPVALSAREFEDFYEGFSNSSLWPLYHDLIVAPSYEAAWWEAYQEVNRKFADAAAAAAAPGATVWVQDYQLQLVPGLLKQARPDVTVGFFLHIPFPSPDLFRQLPWRDEITRGLAGCDLIGFQREEDERNFRALVGPSGPRSGTFPISIDPQAIRPGGQEDVETLRERLGAPETVMLGVDRMDYTKGILQRLLAVECLLEQGTLGRVAVVQLTTPSRERIEHYQQTRREVEEAVGRINGRFGEVGRPIVHYIHRPVPKAELGTYYRAADVMLVTPFKDGMNLVAKEFVSCCADDAALVLSEFAGAAVELDRAHLCNPFDVGSIQEAITAAVGDHRDARVDDMRAMRRAVLGHDVFDWAREFLGAL
ncbi:alpha,alpha-trehalose-phosphate synthase (UDP-forming) [Corynebacterium liangguodongii]|uniref:alpha,alpha-trehalose-phosphate synthase (ADP-forming) n=1 Tax=Corynebacterium liangguodongii TaxID=2079535 RepID=A0A2S0WFY1_9CORY|nr:trehalose-6-phosphate synthase [Corynebacterium liangguodongii]AWB84634.1 trehalose-6-phosphate synthase [Corynebacterium liangguodongii]PWB99642.1 trehalose-6-phosphate synthase [Corynebacterium liangguodongii]